MHGLDKVINIIQHINFEEKGCMPGWISWKIGQHAYLKSGQSSVLRETT